MVVGLSVWFNYSYRWQIYEKVGEMQGGGIKTKIYYASWLSQCKMQIVKSMNMSVCPPEAGWLLLSILTWLILL